MRSKRTRKNKDDFYYNVASFYPFFLLTSIIIVSSCTTLLKKQPPLPAITDPKSFLENIISKKNSYNHLSAIAKIKIHAAQRMPATKNVIFVQTPSFLRIETVGMFNQPYLLFTTDGKNINLFDLTINAFYSGEANEQNLSVMFGTNITVDDAVTLFLGFPPVFYQNSPDIFYQQDGRDYLFILTYHDKKSEYLWINPRLERVVKYAYYNQLHEPVYEFSFQKFKAVGEKKFPMKIDLKFFLTQTEITIKYNTINVGEKIPDELFSLLQPPSAKSVPLKNLFTEP